MKVRVGENSESWEVFPVEEINGRFVFRAHRNPPIVQKKEIPPRRMVSQQLLEDLDLSSSSSSASSTPEVQVEQVQSIPLEVDLTRRLEDLPAQYHAEQHQKGLLDAIIEKCRQPPQEIPQEPLVTFPIPSSADDYIPPIPPLEGFQFDFPTPSPSLTPSPQEESLLLATGTTTKLLSSPEVDKSKILANCFGPSKKSREMSIAKPPEQPEVIFRVPEVPKPRIRNSKPEIRRQIPREQNNLDDRVEKILKSIKDFKLPRCLSPIRNLSAPPCGKRRTTFDGYKIPKIPRKDAQKQNVVHESAVSVKDSIYQQWAVSHPTPNKRLSKYKLKNLCR